MAKITKLGQNKYKIQYIPEGYRDLYKNPYRCITVTGKDHANNIYKDAKLVEERDRISSKLNGKINSVNVIIPELTIGVIFKAFKINSIPYKQYAAKTIKRYIALMEKLENDLGSDFHFSKIDYPFYYSRYGNPKKKNSGITALKCLNHIGNWAREQVSEGKIRGTINAKPIKLPKVVKSKKNALKPYQVDMIFNHPEICHITKAIIELYILTGCRISELCRPDFTWEQIDVEGEVAYIKNKGHKREFDEPFEIPFFKNQHQRLVNQINDHFKPIHPEAHIYPIPISAKNVYDRIVSASEKVGFKFTPHDFRDTSATILLRESGNIYAVKEHLGHANVKDTEDAYADWIMDDKVQSSASIVKSIGRKSVDN